MEGRWKGPEHGARCVGMFLGNHGNMAWDAEAMRFLVLGVLGVLGAEIMLLYVSLEDFVRAKMPLSVSPTICLSFVLPRISWCGVHDNAFTYGMPMLIRR